MKIAFSGAGGTGKTTLAKYISEKWGIPYVGSVSREVMAEMGVESEVAQNNMSEEDLFKLQWAIYERRKQKNSGHPHFVTDRLALDNYVYGLRRCGKALSKEAHDAWYRGVEEDLASFDLVFYTPNGLFETVDDGIRQADIAHNWLVDSAIYGLLCKLAFDRMAGHVYVLSMPDLQRRKDFIDRLALDVAEVTMGKVL